MPKEMVIFARTYDLLTWLIPQSEKFPRPQRFVVTKRLQDAALDFQERIVEANTLPARQRTERAALLRQADAELLKLRIYLRLVHRWQWLSQKQYVHVSVMVAEIGKLLGGWLKATEHRTQG